MSKTVIVTGASSGLGFAIARAYLERGYNVVGNARTQARLEEAAAKLATRTTSSLWPATSPGRKPPAACSPRLSKPSAEWTS